MADETKEELTPAEEAEALETIEKEINNEVVGNVNKIINPPTEEEKAEQKEEAKPDEIKEEDKPAEEVKEDKEQTEEVKDESTDEDKSETTPTVADLNLPNRLIQAAKRNHVSDEEVLKLGDKAELVLGKLADASDAVSQRLGELGRKAKDNLKPAERKEIKVPTLKLPEEFDSDAGKQLQDTITALTAKITELETALTNRESQSTLVSNLERDKKIDGFFDGVSDGYPEFGKAEKLTNAELVMRQNVWEIADNIQMGAKFNGEDISIEEALNQSMSIYEGKHPTKVREKIVKEVQEREKQIISRPNSKKTVTLPANSEKEAVKAVKAWLNKGKDGWKD